MAGFFAFCSGAAQADRFTDDLIQTYRGLGFDSIDINHGTDQVGIDAIRGPWRYQVICDRSTGTILKQGTNPADATDEHSGGSESGDHGSGDEHNERGSGDRD